MKKNPKQSWETPELKAHGTVEEITAQGKRNGQADVPFPDQAPDITGSEPL